MFKLKTFLPMIFAATHMCFLPFARAEQGNSENVDSGVIEKFESPYQLFVESKFLSYSDKPFVNFWNDQRNYYIPEIQTQIDQMLIDEPATKMPHMEVTRYKLADGRDGVRLIMTQKKQVVSIEFIGATNSYLKVNGINFTAEEAVDIYYIKEKLEKELGNRKLKSSSLWNFFSPGLKTSALVGQLESFAFAATDEATEPVIETKALPPVPTPEPAAGTTPGPATDTTANSSDRTVAKCRKRIGGSESSRLNEESVQKFVDSSKDFAKDSKFAEECIRASDKQNYFDYENKNLIGAKKALQDAAEKTADSPAPTKSAKKSEKKGGWAWWQIGLTVLGVGVALGTGGCAARVKVLCRNFALGNITRVQACYMDKVTGGTKCGRSTATGTSTITVVNPTTVNSSTGPVPNAGNFHKPTNGTK